jgi:hypothetical protein
MNTWWCTPSSHHTLKGEARLQGWKGGLSEWGNSAVRPGREVYTRPVGQLLRGRTSEYGQGTLLQRGRVL